MLNKTQSFFLILCIFIIIYILSDYYTKNIDYENFDNKILNYMGFIFFIFGILKLYDIHKFTKIFNKYDIETIKNESVIRSKNNLKVSFIIHDTEKEINIIYEGILPDLFAEGRGVIVRGQFKDNVFIASQVLAKHDEKYMPRELEKSLNEY